MKRLALALAALAFVAQPLVAQEGPRIAHQPSSRLPFSAAMQVGNTYWLSGKRGATGEAPAAGEGRRGGQRPPARRGPGRRLRRAVGRPRAAPRAR